MGSLNTENLNNKDLYFFQKFTKNDLVYTYYINLVEATIRHQKLSLTCRELRSSCMECNSFQDATSKNGQTNFKNLVAFAARFWKCVWRF